MVQAHSPGSKPRSATANFCQCTATHSIWRKMDEIVEVLRRDEFSGFSKKGRVEWVLKNRTFQCLSINSKYRPLQTLASAAVHNPPISPEDMLQSPQVHCHQPTCQRCCTKDTTVTLLKCILTPTNHTFLGEDDSIFDQAFNMHEGTFCPMLLSHNSKN